MPISDETRKKLVRSHRFGADMVDIASRAHFKCEYCSADMLGSVDAYEWNWEREHITPTSAGGEDDLENWAMACRVCNQLKGRGTRGSTAEIPPGAKNLSLPPAPMFRRCELSVRSSSRRCERWSPRR